MKRCCKMCGNEIICEKDGKILHSYGRMFCNECVPKDSYDSTNARLSLRYGYDYKTHKICLKCGVIKEKNNSNFSMNNKKPGKVIGSYCRICNSVISSINTRITKQKCIEYKGGCCQKCGYNKCNAALDFHHLDPNEKDFAISQSSKNSLESLKPELDKCILLCSNCHRELHNEQFEQKMNENIGNFKNDLKDKIELPDDATFIKLFETKTPLDIADEYNISLGSVYRKIRKLELK